MENIKNLMGSAYHEGVTIEEVNSFLAGKKMVNLNDGGYVAKDKFDRVENEKKQLQIEHDSLKESTKDFEKIKAENDGFKKEKANADLKAKVLKLGIDEKFFNYVKMDIDSKTLELGEDEKTNKAAVDKYLKEHPQFASKTEPGRQVVITTKLGNPSDNPDQAQAKVNGVINNGIRRAAGRKIDIEEDVE